jgi:hypothetical protein
MVEILVPAYNLEKLDRVMLATEKKKSPVLKAVKDPRISNGSTAVPWEHRLLCGPHLFPPLQPVTQDKTRHLAKLRPILPGRNHQTLSSGFTDLQNRALRGEFNVSGCEK